MSSVLALLVLVCLTQAVSVEVTPVEKVISLLEDLKTETEEEGKAEASTYDKFACFCKSTTEEKSEAILAGQDTIEGLAATLQEQTTLSAAKAFQIKEMDELLGKLDKEIAEVTATRDKEKTKYESEAADLAKAVSSLEGAITNMNAGMGGSFAQLQASVRRSLLLTDTVVTSTAHARALIALLQETPAATDGMNDGSNDIVALLEGLEKDFKARKLQLDRFEGRNAQDFTDVMKTKTEERATAADTKATAEGERSAAEEAIATASDDTLMAEAELKDNEVYMKDTTQQCELKAREWDQRSQMRAGEVEALGKAISIIKGRVKGKEGARALLQVSRQSNSATRSRSLRDLPMAFTVHDLSGALSLLQETRESPRARLGGLAKKVDSRRQQDDRHRQEAIAALVEKGQKLKSPVLLALVSRVNADPFLKVKKLIQELIERLVTEAAEESSKKGWCDTETGKATHNRDSNHNKVLKLNGKLMRLEAKKATLEEELSKLSTELADLNDALAKMTKQRSEEKAENMNTLDEAKAGLAATKDAYDVLKTFYSNAAKGKVSLLQATPNLGNQAKAGGIFAMLDVILSDFERTVRVVTDAEGEAQAAFVDFERTSKVSISSKEMGKSQAESDLKETDQHIAEAMERLGQHQKMLDDSLKELEELRPTCVDTGMSAAEKKSKREEEIDALKSALCQLDAEGVEPDCA